MAFEIVERTVNGETDKRALVDNVHSPLVRKMSIGSDWNQLLIGVRWSTRRDSDWNPAPRLYLGVTAGTIAPPGTATPNHFLGHGFRTIFQNSTNLIYLLPGGANNCFRTYIANGVETNTPISLSARQSVLKTGVGRSDLYVRITKGSPNWGLETCHGAESNPPNITPEEFNDSMSGGPSYIWRNLGSQAVDESTYGDLDSVCLVFLGTTDGFEVSDFAYSKLS